MLTPKPNPTPMPRSTPDGIRSDWLSSASGCSISWCLRRGCRSWCGCCYGRFSSSKGPLRQSRTAMRILPPPSLRHPPQTPPPLERGRPLPRPPQRQRRTPPPPALQVIRGGVGRRLGGHGRRWNECAAYKAAQGCRQMRVVRSYTAAAGWKGASFQCHDDGWQ
jgi:hypothetical protein